MSRIKSFLTVTAGAAAGLFLTALASGATANADTAVGPALPGVFEQVVASSAAIPQQLLQSTASALTGTPLTPAASTAQGPLATATLNMPQMPGTTTPAASPSATGLPGLSGLSNLSSVLPFPLPNLGGAAAPVAPAAPAMLAPTSFMPPVAIAPVDPVSMVAIPGLP